MTTLLFAIAFWLVIAAAAFGALMLGAFVWFLVSDWWYGPQEHPVVGRQVPPPPRAVPLRPYDWDDPLERQFLLPDAPNPTWRIA